MGKEIENDRVGRVGRSEEVYGMSPFGSVDSREQIASIVAHSPTRTRSTMTGHSEAVEAEPKHFLNRTG